MVAFISFYIINTFISEGRKARRDNYITITKDPADLPEPI